MIYDCFLFNDELDLLELRLEYMYNHVDFFVIAESSQTFTSLAKKLYFKENKDRFSRFLSKIIHIEIAPNPSLDSAWENEYFQRNHIKTALSNCSDQDIILISDVDEIINIESIQLTTINKPVLVQLFYYYYFLNLKSNLYNEVVLLARYKDIAEKNIGNRLTYKNFACSSINCEEINTGWHFSYFFGNDIDRYTNKIKSFSHQEFNTEYILNKNRIHTVLKYGIDFFERYDMRFFPVNAKKDLSVNLYKSANQLGFLSKYSFKHPRPTSINSKRELYFYTRYLKNIFRLNVEPSRQA